MESFNYRPLKGSEIRCIVVHNLKDEGESSLVQCSLLQAPIEDLSYIALSYTWGDPEVTKPILLGGCRVEITTNLESYLRHVANRVVKRPTTEEHGRDCIWIDALCIDQNNSSERNEQVLRMGDIYSLANKVVVWFGPEGENTHAGIERLKQIAQEVDNLGGLGEVLFVPEKRLIAARLWQETLESPNSSHRDGLGELFQFPWWERIWTLQEAALAKTVSFMCGDDILSFDDFYHGSLPIVAQVIEDHDKGINILAISIPISDALGIINLRSIVERLGTNPARYAETTIQALLQNLGHKSASDSRDKIYGLLGIASDSWKRHMMPNYDLSVEEVYRDTVKTHLRHTDSLSILGQCCPPYTPDTIPLPSWIPHWESSSMMSRRPGPFFWQKYSNLDTDQPIHPYHASRDLPLSSHPWSMDEESGTLQLTGCCIDTIETLSEPVHYEEEQERHSLVDMAREWLSMAQSLDPVYEFTNEKMEAALRRTMVGDYNNFAKVEPQGVKRKQRGFALILPDEPPSTIDGITWNHRDTMQTFGILSRNRCIAVTSKGWLALVSASTEIGDQIAVLIGGQTLYILRGVNESEETELRPVNMYSLIGEAYVHGFMDGKALDQQNLGPIHLH